MNFRLIPVWAAFVALLFFAACTKIETTSIGSDLIPVVDNVHTFETVLDVIGNNNLDTLPLRVSASNPHMVGHVDEPVFGSSSVSMFFQMSPSSFPHIPVKADSLTGAATVGFDSAVLSLDYVGYYGDSTQSATFKLYQANEGLHYDQGLTPWYTITPTVRANKSILWGSAIASVKSLNQDTTTVIVKPDTNRVVKQLRIKLDAALALKLLAADTSKFLTDTTYRDYMPGFALEAEGALNTLFYFNIKGTNSKIQFFYRANPKSAKQDTTTASFTVTALSGHAINFTNDKSGAAVLSHLTPDAVNGKSQLFIQASPGTYATLSIPGLDTFVKVNRLINRAELRIVEDEPITQPLTPPQVLYLDVIDTATKTFQGVPYDLSPYQPYYCYPSGSNRDISLDYFGGVSKAETIGGTSLNVYKFNIARYLQSVMTRKERLFPQFRLSAPFYMFYQECSNGGLAYPQQVVPFTQGGTLLNVIGRGRIVLAGSGSSVPEGKRMKLRIIYTVL